MKRKVTLTYFKESGKFYSRGEYTSIVEHVHQVFHEVRLMRQEKRLPNITDGSEFTIHVDFLCDDTDGYPALINLEN